MLVVRCALRSTADVAVVLLERESMLGEVHRQLRLAAHGEGDPALVARARSRWGYALWSRLRPDVGTGSGSSRSASLGKRRAYFKAFFKWLKKSTNQRDLWGVLEETGARVDRKKAFSFIEWKKRIHFDPTIRPTRAEIDKAKRFLDATAAELAEAEDRHRRSATWKDYADDRLPEEFYKWVRGDVTRLVRTHNLSDGIVHAATLLSYAFRVQLGNWVASEVLQNLPAHVLHEASTEIYKHMWIASEVGLDDEGRFELPIMGSPALAAAIEYVAEISDDGTIRDKEGILADVLAFAASDRLKRNRGVNIALGFGALYQAWVKDERDRDRTKTRRALDLDRLYRAEVEGLSDVQTRSRKRPRPDDD